MSRSPDDELGEPGVERARRRIEDSFRPRFDLDHGKAVLGEAIGPEAKDPGGADIATRVIAQLANPSEPPFAELTARERDVLRLLGGGLTNTAIAQRLLLAPKSVRNLVSSVLAKLGVDSREAAGDIARQSGLGR